VAHSALLTQPLPLLLLLLLLSWPALLGQVWRC
jgi:hypothetical protein